MPLAVIKGETSGIYSSNRHLRWTSRYFDEHSTAKKCSPSRWNLKPRVSSAIFPASPSFFYARTSAECESPRMIRHSHSHSEFPTESIPLCQVNQPRSENSKNFISINVPVIASSVNEKTQTRKPGGGRPSKRLNEIITIEESECRKKDKEKSELLSIEGKNEKALRFYYAREYQRNEERSEKTTEKDKTSETEPLFLVETTESEKPKRYNKSSLKKQKVRYDDRYDDSYDNDVPTAECQDKNPKPKESDTDKNRKNQKAVEMRRKAFLRKISLQDTHLNYNQDYWLDFKKSGRFHKSIDLGYFGNEENASEKVEGVKDVVERNDIWIQPIVHCCQINTKESLAITRQSNLPLNSRTFIMRRADSDPIILTHAQLPYQYGLENFIVNPIAPDPKRSDSSELLSGPIFNCRAKTTLEKKSSWFFLASNDNIPLFSERNGLIETDFDVLDEKAPDNDFQTEEDNTYAIPIDLSDFCEIKLTSESDSDSGKRFQNLQDGCSFFDETLTSGDSDVFYETEPPGFSEDERFQLPPSLHRSSPSPPKTTSQEH